MSLMQPVASLALRELWYSFRLLLVIVCFVGAGALAALVPGSPGELLDRLAAALAVAAAVAAMAAAGALAGERRRGSAGWLLSCGVPRRALLAGWYLALVTPLALGLVASGTLGWLAVSGRETTPPPLAYVLALAAVAAAALAGLAFGALVAAWLSPMRAAAVALAACAAVAALALLVPVAAPYLPAAGPLAVAALPEASRPVGDALRATGIGLAFTAALLAMARVAWERTDL
jgi:hypothetical protein